MNGTPVSIETNRGERLRHLRRCVPAGLIVLLCAGLTVSTAASAQKPRRLEDLQTKAEVKVVRRPPAARGGATIDFENLAGRTRVTTQYASQGVQFHNAYLSETNKARSGSKALRVAPPSTEFHTGPMLISFSSGKSRVKLYAYSVHSVTGTLKAYDATNRVVDTDGPRAVSTSGHDTAFEVKTPTAVIRRVELQYASTALESIDDLEFVGEEPATLPTTAATVVITSPVDGERLSSNRLVLAGTVSGEQLVSPGKVENGYGLPPGSSAPSPSVGSIGLAGSGDSRTFRQTRIVGVGPQTLTVKVENAAGLVGSDDVRVTYYPVLLGSRIDSEGAALGAFSFGGASGECTYAVFTQAAVAAIEGRTHLIRGPILAKWRSLVTTSGYPSMGCPIDDELQVAEDAARRQTFQKGRIFHDATGTFQVPEVFVDAMAQRGGGEAAFGIPVADPSSSIGRMQTWAFQGFRRPGRVDPEVTLEIRGSPPRLYVQRIGGDLSAVEVVSPTTPTLTEVYPCSNFLGPCDVSLPDEPPLPESTMADLCSHDHYRGWEFLADITPGTDPDPPEWPAVTSDHETSVLRGIATKSRPSTEDNPLTHEIYRSCPDFAALTAEQFLDEERRLCISDWHTDVVPVPGFRGLMGEGKTHMPVEYEMYYAQHFNVLFDDPRPGDLIFAAGRWIVDCGHDYKTEIHPPAVWAHMRTGTHNGHPATLAMVWANGWYTGDAVELEIHPPPRPSPNALLNVFREHGDEIDVTVDDTIVGSEYLKLTFSASPRRNSVTPSGEMKWMAGRGYEARYKVYWTER